MDGDGNFDGLSAMGFECLHQFDEVSCDATTFTMQPPS
jgi:beta-N-acetylhexosaminidase